MLLLREARVPRAVRDLVPACLDPWSLPQHPPQILRGAPQSQRGIDQDQPAGSGSTHRQIGPLVLFELLVQAKDQRIPLPQQRIAALPVGSDLQAHDDDEDRDPEPGHRKAETDEDKPEQAGASHQRQRQAQLARQIEAAGQPHQQALLLMLRGASLGIEQYRSMLGHPAGLVLVLERETFAEMLEQIRIWTGMIERSQT